MRAAVLGIAALCAPVVFAVPHGADNHRHRHPPRPARRDFETDYSTVTDVVTITANNAVVWVDQFNNVISTEYHGQATPTVLPSDSETSSLPAPTFTAPASASASAESSSTTPDTPPAASSPIPAFSVYTSAPAASGASPVPLTTDDGEATTTASTSPDASPSVVNKGSDDSNNNKVDTSSGSSGYAGGSGFGICYELIGTNGCIPQSQLNSDFGYLSTQGYSKIRFYDIGCDLSVATAAAAAAGFSVTLGLNTINNVNNDLNTLIGMIKGNWGPIDTVVIGNEVISQGGSAGQIADAVNSARGQLQSAGFTKNVVAVDTFIAHQSNPQICAASDYCAVNAHAFFDANTVAQNAGTFVHNVLPTIQNNGKPIIITESGWPYQGGANGKAIPSTANQDAAIGSLKSAFGGNPGGLFLFQAYDATYKAPGPFGVEQFFGIYGH
ncbi:Cell surface mannoprotein mp65 [Cladophialophora chaetospira]|uniref:Cell surface mannoprotein mp65 n=1 Tax=Cladophialophora chaetospira TaxID=386627 RepID=A0AA38WYQ9_9EURO|nr:Cell surface mannoprotein mp65 [Cladophialophora chaetospira]